MTRFRRSLVSDEEILQQIDRNEMGDRARVKEFLIAEGRPDLAKDLDAKYREIDLGIYGARGTWHALSGAQRGVLIEMGNGYPLNRKPFTSQFMITLKNGMCCRACNLPTARNLCARELIAVDGGIFDPEQRFVITERGRFVLKHGQTDD